MHTLSLHPRQKLYPSADKKWWLQFPTPLQLDISGPAIILVSG
jgi:hypothetical protein